MNNIESKPIASLGYNFIPTEYLPEGSSEYDIRNMQHGHADLFRQLTQEELNILIANRNQSDNWENVRVADGFKPELVADCKFYGLVRIGRLDAVYKEFHDFKIPVGLHNSTIVSSDIGDNVCIDNVHYMSHYILDHDVIIANVNELVTTNHSKFGNGILKVGEEKNSRTWVEVCNENGGRKILPFNGMLAGDAYLWSKYRDDETLMNKFVEFTDKRLDEKRGYYGKIGARSVIKNCAIIKDVWIGTDAYLKGANKIKNVTINSDAERKSQIGEGCEIVNGIVGYGCRIFYGVKAVRFILSAHSQLKYGARLINSYLGNNSTISCCEVLNSLIFPSHEQHHNNSFLCASLLMGQSNLAAGATIGSNHNSRAADGEIVAGRGFWPGLCVSLKHNSKFASFIILAKGDYPAEVNIPLPFSLVSLDGDTDQTIVMPAYWFMYNMYATERNAWKTNNRDKRIEKKQFIEYDYLAPDTINEIFTALEILESLEVDANDSASIRNWENGKRETKLVKVSKAITTYKEVVNYYAAARILKYAEENNLNDFSSIKKSLTAKTSRSKWINVGGQLIRQSALRTLMDKIKNGEIEDWSAVHLFYKEQGKAYKTDKLQHAYTALLELHQITGKQFTAAFLTQLLTDALKTRTWMTNGIYGARAKDYTNEFRKMVYDNAEEMNEVLGKLEDNEFVQTELEKLEIFSNAVKHYESILTSETKVVKKVTAA